MKAQSQETLRSGGEDTLGSGTLPFIVFVFL